LRKTRTFKNLTTKNKTNRLPVFRWVERFCAFFSRKILFSFFLSLFLFPLILLTELPVFAQNTVNSAGSSTTGNSQRKWFSNLGSANTSDNASSEYHLLLPSWTTPLHTAFPTRPANREPLIDNAVNNELPGFGTLQPKVPAKSSAIGTQLLAKTIKAATPYQGVVPAIYIEGAGYVPITHPDLEPYLDPAVLENPESEPSVVMIPQSLLSGYWTGETASIGTIPKSTRIINAAGQTTLSYPKNDHVEPIIVSADSGWTKETNDYEILFLKGDCSVRQGDNSVQGPQAVVWIAKKKDPNDQTREVTVYFESGNNRTPLRIELDQNNENVTISDQKWLGRLTTPTSVGLMIMNPVPAQEKEPPIYQRALAIMLPESSVISQVDYVTTAATKTTGSVSASPSKKHYRNYIVNPRNGDYLSIMLDPFPNQPNRGVGMITQGVNLIINDVTGEELLAGNTVDVSADNAVIWTNSLGKLFAGSEFKEESEQDFEVYLEGNIVFRDAKRTIQANRMYYDAKNKVAYILNGRLESPIEQIKNINGTIYLKAEILRQLGDGLFTAKNSVITTSQLGVPSYSLRSKVLTLKEQVVTTPFNNQPRSERLLVAENNFLTMQNIPVFYWPWMAADLNDPSFYLKNIAYGNSSLYGNQIKTLWNPFQLLNIRNRPDWLDGDVGVSWLEKRGISHGVRLRYSPSRCLGINGTTNGNFEFWGINDIGLDSLGGRRRNVPFPHQYRYRLFWKHYQEISAIGKYQGPWFFFGQAGKVSDANVTNNYFHNDWLLGDNNTTSAGLKKIDGNSSYSIFAEYALDDCYTNANWLPRLDHFLMGQSLLNDRLTWYEHTRIGYMNYSTASAPYDWATDGRYFSYLPWELTPNSPSNTIPNPANPSLPVPETVNQSGEIFSTRHELDLPFSLGHLRVVPFALGEFSHWGKDRSGGDVQRFYGQGGVRLNLPFWQVRPNCSSRTWYVNGLAHKIDLDAEFSYARADQDMERLIMTDALDTWTIEEFRRRYSVTTFGSLYGNTFPMYFDPRYYALRNGMGGKVAAGNMEIADDMTLCRVGITNRWQTKRGPVGRRHIIDWITLSAHFNYYPESEYNYGESIGLIDYDFLWHVGDRFSLFSSGLYDTFPQGQRITRVGGTWARPERGNFSMMLDQLDGAVQKTYITLNVGYTMNEKYSFNYTTAFDVTEDWRNTGHNFSFTRTGESFRVFVGAIYSEARDDWSFTFGLEPVFMRGIARKIQSFATQAVTTN
jgi:hypothetical protein